MAISLTKLCDNIKSNYNMTLVAGSGGMENTVRWVHMVEDREVPDFLHGNELVFTTGIGHINGGGGLTTFVKKLREHGAVGVVFNLGPYISYIPKEVIDYCNENDFPLFELPWDVHIIDITYDFCRRIIENEKYEVSVADAFRNTITSPSDIGKYHDVFEKSGFGQANNYRIIVVDFFKNGQKITEWVEENNRERLWRMLTKSENSATMFLHESHIVVIRQNCDAAEVNRMFSSLTKTTEMTNMDFTIGISSDNGRLESVPLLFKQAVSAYVTARADKEKMVFYDDIGMNKLILGAENHAVLESFSKGMLGPIKGYDILNRSDYEKTLRDYLMNDCSVKTVSEMNGVHRNTINYKIKQIREIFGTRLNEREKAEFMLAFRINDLLKYL